MDHALAGMPGTEARMTKPTELGTAFRAWMDHLAWKGTCPICNKGATADEDRYCDKGRELRAVAIAELTGKPIGTGERAGKVWPA